MKTITKKYKVYTFDELSETAKEKALSDYNMNNDFPFLSDDIIYHIEELLKENGIEAITEITPFYSLSYCQGDGVMFEGTFNWKNYTITTKQSGHYYHEKSVDYSFENNADENDDTRYDDNDEFIELYESICRSAEKYGYDVIETEQSEENFAEICFANDYTFLENGEMFND